MSEPGNGQSGEDRLIDRFFRPLATHPGALGFIDDAACLTPPPGEDLVLTVDASVAGVHFFSDDPADAVAKKALRVNLSDLAAKGARPLGVLLSISLPAEVSEDWLENFARGLGDDLRMFDCSLLGGDTTRTGGAMTIAITAVGSVPTGTMIRRSGAKAGDFVVVTGTIGDSVLGLRLRQTPDEPAFARLDAAQKAFLSRRYLLPEPRLPLAPALREHASAAIDVSDGLAGDLAKVAASSKVRAVLAAGQVPLSEAGRGAVSAQPALLETAITGGDDYEVLASVPENRLASLQAAAKAVGVPLTAIGRMEAGDGLAVRDPDGRPMRLKTPSFSHF